MQRQTAPRPQILEPARTSARGHFDPTYRIQTRPATQPIVANSNRDSYRGNDIIQHSNHADVHSNPSRLPGYQPNVLSATTLNQYGDGQMTTMDRRYPYMIKDAYQKYWKESDVTKNNMCYQDRDMVQRIGGLENSRDIVV